VDRSLLRWVPYDGVGRSVRNGLNFTERGFGVRGAVGCSDRGHTAASQLTDGDIDWELIFGECGTRWFHTGGIFAGLSETTPTVIEQAMSAAKLHGTVVSYDLNYRASLWKSAGGPAAAQEVNRRLVPHVDVLFGNEEDFTAALGFELQGTGRDYSELDPRAFEGMMARVAKEFSNLKLIATTLRVAKTASRNDWGAVCYGEGKVYRAPMRMDLEILDRVGGGDSFASGFIWALMEGRDLQWAVECGAAHGALAMTTPGDSSMATLAEVEKLMSSATARVER
jgi:2-dehydro-3-deoxygluconokinase